MRLQLGLKNLFIYSVFDAVCLFAPSTVSLLARNLGCYGIWGKEEDSLPILVFPGPPMGSIEISEEHRKD